MSNQEWETPKIFDILDEEFGFLIDLAATKENTKCDLYYGPDHEDKRLRDSFKLPYWLTPNCNRGWLNPGFKDMLPWIERAYLEANRYPESVIVVLGLLSPSAHWFTEWGTKAHEIRLIGDKRIQFIPPKGVKKTSNPKENALYIFRYRAKWERENPPPPNIRFWDHRKALEAFYFE